RGRRRVLQQLQPGLTRGQPLRGDPGADHHRGQERAAQELSRQPTPQQDGCTGHAAILTGQSNSVKIESMSDERVSELERRTSIHAALSDPARLRITDTLLAGDASPSELAAMLAMPSNLLAHHLHVLEQAGLVTRRRSEGDRRRTYLQLIPGALDALAPPPARAAVRVLFVCTANSARSHLAAALWRRARDRKS